MPEAFDINEALEPATQSQSSSGLSGSAPPSSPALSLGFCMRRLDRQANYSHHNYESLPCVSDRNE